MRTESAKESQPANWQIQYVRLCASCKAAPLHRFHRVPEKAIQLGEEPLGIIKHDEMPGRVRHGKMQRAQTLILFFERLLKLRPGHIHATGAELLVLAAPAAEHEDGHGDFAQLRSQVLA